jgi:hypothetical protein
MFQDQLQFRTKRISKVGVTKSIEKSTWNVFLKGQTPYITVNQATKEIIVLPNIELNVFYTNLGVEGGDIIVSMKNRIHWILSMK